MNLKMQARITWYSWGFYCENYHCLVLRLYDQFMTHHISRGFESDVSWAKKRGGKKWNIGKCCPKADPFAKINGRWKFLGTGRREGQIRKPVRKKAGLLWKLLKFKTWKRIFATWRQVSTLGWRSSLWKYAKTQEKLTLHERFIVSVLVYSVI